MSRVRVETDFEKIYAQAHRGYADPYPLQVGLRNTRFQFCYQFGVLLSRSSVYCFKIEKIELLTAFQYINFIVLLLEAYYRFIPNVWITLGISLFEGLVGGAVYVNAFYRVSTEVESKYREFSMGAASMADSTGITLAGLVAIQLHNYLCSNAKSPI
eukprot:gene19299-21221_t